MFLSLLDKRAAADRPAKPNVTALANEIMSANPNAVVIANRVNDERVLTFQGAKGYNGLEDRDVYIITGRATTRDRDARDGGAFYASSSHDH
jgi:hypothetical protein